MFLLHALLRKYLLVFYHSKQVLIATSNLYEMLNTKILLKVHSLCIFSEKNAVCIKNSVYVSDILYWRIVGNKMIKRKKKSHKVVTLSLEKWCPVLAVYVKWEAYWSILHMLNGNFLLSWRLSVLLFSLWTCDMEVKCWIMKPFLISQRVYLRI